MVFEKKKYLMHKLRLNCFQKVLINKSLFQFCFVNLIVLFEGWLLLSLLRLTKILPHQWAKFSLIKIMSSFYLQCSSKARYCGHDGQGTEWSEGEIRGHLRSQWEILWRCVPVTGQWWQEWCNSSKKKKSHLI